MPGKRIPDLPAIAGASTANDDNLVIFDTDASTTKRILRSQLAAGLVGDLPYTPAGSISATTVPTAIAELDTEKVAFTRLDDSDGSNLVGFLQSGSGAAATTVQAALRRTVSAKDFGAVGDGVTDDSVALTAFFAACAAGNKGYINAGVYICEAVNILSNTDVEGAGANAAILKLKSGAATPQILRTTSSRSNISFRNIGFDCNNVVSGVALNLNAVTNARVLGCRFTSKYGIYLLGTCDDVRISSNTFDANNYAVITEASSATSNISVIGNTFKNCTADGVEINCPTGSGRNWTIQGNTFDTIGANTVAGFGVGASGGTAYIDGLSIVGNTFYRCDHQAVHLEDGVRNVVVKGNTILDCGFGSTQTFRSGIYIAASVATRKISNIVVEGNTIKGVADMQYGVYAAGSQAMTGLMVRGNIVEAHLLYGVFTGSVVTGFSIDGNVIYNGAGPGIRAAANSGTYSDNVCFDNQSPKTQTYGIEINTGTDVNFISNILKDNLTGAFLITSAGTRNRFLGNVESTAATSTLTGTAVAFGGQLNFPATQNASSDVNTLDDYEEGVWTPVLTFTTPGDLSVAYSVQVGAYTKIGRLVLLNFNVTTSTFTHTTASGELRITGAPFTTASTTNIAWHGAMQWGGITKANYTYLCARFVANTTEMAFAISGSGQATTAVAAGDVPTGGTVVLRGTIAYHTG